MTYEQLLMLLTEKYRVLFARINKHEILLYDVITNKYIGTYYGNSFIEALTKAYEFQG